MTPTTESGAFMDDLWPLPLNWTLAIGAFVLFWLGVLCGALWMISTS